MTYVGYVKGVERSLTKEEKKELLGRMLQCFGYGEKNKEKATA